MSEITTSIRSYVSSTMLDDPNAAIDGKTPLLEWGVLNSLNIAKLMSFIRKNHGVTVPPEEIVGSNFNCIEAIARMVVKLKSVPSAA